jgi:vacuole morphology and inheritance protein 14
MPSTPQVFCRLPPNRKSPQRCLTEANRRGPRSITLTSRSKLGREDIKWQELLLHFRTVQAKHEKARRQALGTHTSGFSPLTDNSTSARIAGPASGRLPMRRRVTGEAPPVLSVTPVPTTAATINLPSRAGALSPLNPSRVRVHAGLSASALGVGAGGQGPISPTAATSMAAQKQKRAYSLSRKP